MHILTNLDAKTILSALAVIFLVFILIKGMNTPAGGAGNKGGGSNSSNNNSSNNNPPAPPAQ